MFIYFPNRALRPYLILQLCSIMAKQLQDNAGSRNNQSLSLRNEFQTC